jgi:delta8-fatty-acid desaturase
LTRQEVRDLADPDELLLIVVGDHVLDCTTWQHHHPGGHLTIRALCGKDATDAFSAFHPDRVEKMLGKFHFAPLLQGGNEEPDPTTLAFRRLTEDLKASGIFETDYGFYYQKAAWLFFLLAAVVAGVLLSDELWVHALSGALLGLFWQQMAFIGHDLAHFSVTHDSNTDNAIGVFVGNFFCGISSGWWKRSHNVHHIVTNSLEYDPDIQHLPILAVNEEYLQRPIFSTFYNWMLPLDGATHFLVGIQHWFYYPLMAVARYNLYVQSLLHAFGLGPYSLSEKTWRRDLQFLALAGFWTWLTLLVMHLPTCDERVAFVLLSHAVAGILHIQITLGHFIMPAYSGVTYDDDKNGWLQTQLKTTMDLDCPPWMDWFHGGLQFQAVHHLWPRAPRHRLRQLAGIVEEFCKEHDLEYHRMSFLRGNYVLLCKLREVASSTKSFSELFSDGMNWSG